MRHAIRGFSSSLVILLSLIFLSVPSLAYPYEKVINFDSGLPSGVVVAESCTFVTSTLPSGSGRALRCGTVGSHVMYVGLNINPITPLTNNVYVRFYVRFMPGWVFGSGSQQLKMVIFNGSHRNFMTVETQTGSPKLTWEDDSCAQYGQPGGRCISTGQVAADGVWRLVEIRSFKNGANGRFTIWLDGVQVMDYAVDIGPSSDATTILEFGYDNASERGNNLGHYLEWEDVVIADHYIGPNRQGGGVGGAVSPSTPLNLMVQY